MSDFHLGIESRIPHSSLLLQHVVHDSKSSLEQKSIFAGLGSANFLGELLCENTARNTVSNKLPQIVMFAGKYLNCTEYFIAKTKNRYIKIKIKSFLMLIC